MKNSKDRRNYLFSTQVYLSMVFLFGCFWCSSRLSMIHIKTYFIKISSTDVIFFEAGTSFRELSHNFILM